MKTLIVVLLLSCFVTVEAQKHVFRMVAVRHKAGSTLLNHLGQEIAKQQQGCFYHSQPSCSSCFGSSPLFRGPTKPAPDHLYVDCTPFFPSLFRVINSSSILQTPRSTTIFQRWTPQASFEWVRDVFPINKPSECRILYQIRHPFDSLVSAFNSFTKTHFIPPGPPGDKTHLRLTEETKKSMAMQNEAGIDHYSLVNLRPMLENIGKMIQEMEALSKIPCSVELLRYEDMVAFPLQWLKKVTSFYQIEDPKLLLHLERWMLDKIPKTVDRSTHIAFYHPGSHLKELKAETIAHLYATVAADEHKIVLEKSGYF